MSVERLRAHYGFSRMPFGRDMAPSMLHRHGAHAEAVARIGWCITQRALGVVTGEVVAGKTVAIRPALAALDPARRLEAVRTLTNHEMDSVSPFAALMVGQSTLRRRIKLGVLAALDQRIAPRYAMPPSRPGSYLKHHLESPRRLRGVWPARV